MNFLKTDLYNFTRNNKISVNVYRPEKQSQAINLISSENPILPIGSQKSYSDCALADKENAFKTERLNKFLFFDEITGILEVQSGVTINDIIKYILPKGWFLNSTPGTKYATVGGMVAADTHGKNQFKSGSLSENIISLKICLPSGDILECANDLNKELFKATLSGYGMSGYIISVKLQLIKINSNIIENKIYKINSAINLQNYFEVKKINSEFLIAWVDHFSVKNNFAKIILQAGNYCKDKEFKKFNNKLILNLEFVNRKISKIISFFLNSMFVAVFNRFVWIKSKEKEFKTNIENFLFPLDAVSDWNYFYGKKGFIQFHFILPESEIAMKKIFEIFEKLKNKKIFSYLITIKKYKKDINSGFLSFPIDGYGVAMDFPNNEKIINFLRNEITEEILDLGGKIYLAKDTILRKDQFERMYKTDAEDFKKEVNNIDFKRKITSLMCKRFGWKYHADE